MISKVFKKNEGFTLIELVLAMAIFGVLVGLVGSNLFYGRSRNSLDGNVQMFVADVKKQQIKTMTGNVGNTTSTAGQFGVSVVAGDSYYKLFQGTNAADDANVITINLDNNITIFSTSNVPNIGPVVGIVFIKESGVISNYSSAITIVFKDSVSSATKTVTIGNKFGYLTQS